MALKRYAVLFLLIAIPFLLTFQDARIREPIHAASLTVLKPALIAVSSVQITLLSARDSFVRFWKTFQDQGRLEEQITELQSKLVTFDEAIKENERLKKLLDFKQTLRTKSIVARIVGGDFSPWRRTLILDKGKKQGLKKDMAVVVPEGLVGRILEVGNQTSRAILLIDGDARVSAVSEQSRAQAVTAGDGSSEMKLKYLDLDSGISVGETVLTSGVGGLFPKGLRIGMITAVSKDNDGLHLLANVKPYVNFSKLEEVICLDSLPEN